MRLRFNKCRIHPHYRGKEPVEYGTDYCSCPSIYRSQNPFGSPRTKQTDGDKHAIYLWRQEGRWYFLETFEDDFDAIVTEEWMERIYSTTDIMRMTMLEELARQIGMI